MDNPYAVVTGGGSGIGRGIALALAEAGHSVIVADLNADSAAAVASEITDSGGVGIPAHVDTTKKSSVRALAEFARQSFPRIDVLANSAGVNVMALLTDATVDDWNYVLSVNLFGIINCCEAFAPLLIEQQSGHIVNNASQAALVVPKVDGLGLYTTSKHACLGYTESLARELSAHSVGVSVLCAGRIQSNLGENSARNRPEMFGGPTEVPEFSAPAAEVMSAEECGRIVVNAIGERRFLIVTHPDRWVEIEERYDAFRRDVEAERQRQSKS